jgi:uncharacterized protein (DUF1697 family)
MRCADRQLAVDNIRNVPAWICLLRAVNMGRQRKVPMATLQRLLQAAGFEDVRTYLQSGNVLLRSQQQARGQVADVVHDIIASEFGFDVPVVVRTPIEIEAVVAANPFPDEAMSRPHLVRVVFLERVPEQAELDRLMSGPPTKPFCHIIGCHMYLDYVEGQPVVRRTAAYFTRVLGVNGTERNWTTVLALARLSSEHYQG